MARRLKLAQKRGPQSMSPELELSVLVRNGLGLDVPSDKIKAFVRGNFVMLSVLAHEIHAAELRETGGIEVGV